MVDGTSLGRPVDTPAGFLCQRIQVVPRLYITPIDGAYFIVAFYREYRRTVAAHTVKLQVKLLWPFRPLHSVRWRGPSYITFCVQLSWEL